MPIWGLYLGGALLLSAIGFGAGWQIREWKADSDRLEIVENSIKLGREQQQLADFKAGRYENQREEAQLATLGRDTEIRTIYRTQQIQVPSHCEPPADALSVLDTSISSANAQITGQLVTTVFPDSTETFTIR